jgi:hypothetical protein
MCWICSVFGVRTPCSYSPSSTATCSLVGFHRAFSSAADAGDSGGEEEAVVVLASATPAASPPACGVSMEALARWCRAVLKACMGVRGGGGTRARSKTAKRPCRRMRLAPSRVLAGAACAAANRRHAIGTPVRARRRYGQVVRREGGVARFIFTGNSVAVGKAWWCRARR